MFEGNLFHKLIISFNRHFENDAYLHREKLFLWRSLGLRFSTEMSGKRWFNIMK